MLRASANSSVSWFKSWVVFVHCAFGVVRENGTGLFKGTPSDSEPMVEVGTLESFTYGSGGQASSSRARCGSRVDCMDTDGDPKVCKNVRPFERELLLESGNSNYDTCCMKPLLLVTAFQQLSHAEWPIQWLISASSTQA